MKRLICILGVLIIGCAGQKKPAMRQPEEIYLQDKIIEIEDKIQDMNDLTPKQKQDLFWFVQYFIYDLAAEQEEKVASEK